MTRTEARDVVVIVGSGEQPYREYLLRSAAERGPVWLLEATEPAWQRAYAVGWSVVPFLDPDRFTPDTDGLIDAARQVAARRGVAGVVTWDEPLVLTAARIAEALDLPGLGVNGAQSCRDKPRTRSALTAAGLVQPRFTVASDFAEAREAAAAVGYPVVVKPRAMGASMGVVRVGGPEELAAAFAIADASGRSGQPAYRRGVLVEEMLTGPEISVDGAVVAGRYTPIFLAHKTTGHEPYFEEQAHVVTADDPLLCDPALLSTLRRAHRALGVADGITHTEVKLTARGPAIVEVNARLGGDLIPYLGLLATGVDAGHLAIDIATGSADRPPVATRRSSAGIRFSYPPTDGRVTKIEVPAPGSVPGLLESASVVEPDTVLRLPPNGYISRYAYVICRADTSAACVESMDRASAAVCLELDPMTEPGASTAAALDAPIH